ncbi:MAG: peptidyl-prolyl cis-trans isomerase [Paludibacteraceae bacterium]|nr:peptidyl-prolyl cis-trans isomerase [Paludibacteraceae bacterium]
MYCVFNRKFIFTLMLGVVMIFLPCCNNHTSQSKSADADKPLVEVEGNYLYRYQIEQIIPPNADKKDSIQLVNNFIRNWATNVLLYETAKQNISDLSEIDKLVEEYRKSLIIHEYQQKLIQQKFSKDISEEETKAFYEKFGNQLLVNEPYVKGLLLVVPANTPQLNEVRSWVQRPNIKSLENIEKYSLKNAISYDFFMNKWIPWSEVLKKIPLQVSNSADFLSNNSFVELSDSTQRYFLKIQEHLNPGDVKPYELAKDEINNILIHKREAEFIKQFENDLYNNAVAKKKIIFYKK